MPKQSQPPRPLWTDRFAQPSAEQLLAGLAKEEASLTQKLREALSGGGLTEAVRWCGLPWRWALVYAGADGEDEAFLVPNPEGPSAVIRLTHEQVGDLPTRKLSRYLREGLAQTRLVAGVCWPEWTFQSQNQVKDLVDLVGLVREASLTEA